MPELPDLIAEAAQYWAKRAKECDKRVSDSLYEDFLSLTVPENIGDRAGRVPLSIERGGLFLFRMLTEMKHDPKQVAGLIGVSLKDATEIQGLYERGAEYVQKLQDDIRNEP